MSAHRKTISVALLLFRANHRNRFSKASAEFRTGMNVAVEDALHDTGNYVGFNSLRPQDVPPGCAPGINDVDCATATMEEKFNGCDDSRRVYYVSRHIRAEYMELEKQQQEDVELHRSNGCTDAERWLCTSLGR
jgi:hypothetical protein